MSHILQDYERHQLRIVVELPELRKISGGLLTARQVMTYAVCVQCGNSTQSPFKFPKYGVRHRYSDFEALSLRLQRRFGAEGMLIPPLPPKSIRNNKDMDFIKSRMNWLQYFMDGIAASPFFFNDLLTQKFLTRTTTGGNDSIVALFDEGLGETLPHASCPPLSSEESPPAPPSTSLTSTHNRGYVQWTEYLSSFVLPLEPEVVIEKVRGEIDTAESAVRATLEAYQALGEGIRQYAKGIQIFSQSMHVLAEGEGKIESLNAVDTSHKDTSEGDQGTRGSFHAEEPHVVAFAPFPRWTPIPALASQAANMFADTVPGYQGVPEQAAYLFLARLEYELVRLQALKGLVAGREALLASILKLQKKVHRLRHGSASPADREVYEGRLATEEVALYKFTKAFLCYTVPHTARERTQNLNRAVANLVALQTSAAAASLARTHSFWRAWAGDSEEVVEEANEVGGRLLLPLVPAFALPVLSMENKGQEGPSQPNRAQAATKERPGAAPRGSGSFLQERAPSSSTSAAIALKGARGSKGTGLEAPKTEDPSDCMTDHVALARTAEAGGSDTTHAAEGTRTPRT